MNNYDWHPMSPQKNERVRMPCVRARVYMSVWVLVCQCMRVGVCVTVRVSLCVFITNSDKTDSDLYVH